jgi:hypothetical protein
MATTRNVQTPGETSHPTPSAPNVADAAAKAVISEGLRAEVAEQETADLQEQLRQMREQVAALTAVVRKTAPAPVVETLPTLKEATAQVEKMDKPAPVLSQEGWVVPAEAFSQVDNQAAAAVLAQIVKKAQA